MAAVVSDPMLELNTETSETETSEMFAFKTQLTKSTNKQYFLRNDRWWFISQGANISYGRNLQSNLETRSYFHIRNLRSVENVTVIEYFWW